MKGMQRVLVVYGIVVTAVCLYFAVLSYQILRNMDTDSAVSAEPAGSTVSTTTTESASVSAGTYRYYLSVRTGQVVILEGDEIFETTGISEEDMSEELRQEVEQKISFDSPEEVYAFLESCSS